MNTPRTIVLPLTQCKREIAYKDELIKKQQNTIEYLKKSINSRKSRNSNNSNNSRNSKKSAYPNTMLVGGKRRRTRRKRNKKLNV
jgi:hypothetical protein